MSLPPVYGHGPLLDRLRGALVTDRFPQAALFTGPVGVGKQRLALWVAQGLLCDEGQGPPCGQCGSCRAVEKLAHPDLHWFVPIPRPKAAEPEKQVAEAGEALGEVMTDRRERPLYSRPDGLAGHGLASIRLLQRRVSLTPFRSRRKVVVLGDADRLVVQEASQEAANAMLKVLEEPPADTAMVLTTSEPQALLPTIRSRVVPIRVARVTDEAVRAFLERELDPAPVAAALDRIVLLAEGRIGRAIALATAGDSADAAAERFLAAVRSGAQVWSLAAFGQSPWGARAEFTGFLDALAARVRGTLEKRATGGRTVQTGLNALVHIETARTQAQGNVNPQLALAVLAGELEALL